MAESSLRIPSREDIRKVLDDENASQASGAPDDDGTPAGMRRHGDPAAPAAPSETDSEEIPHA